MEKSKIVRLLRHFPLADRNEFYRYLKSNFFNRKHRILEFAEILLQAIKGKKCFPSKAHVYHKIFTEEATTFRRLSPAKQEKHLRKRVDMLIYELKTHMEEYLVWKQGCQKSYARDLDLLHAYREIGADSFYFAHLEKMKKSLTATKPIPLENHQRLYSLLQMSGEHPGFRRWDRSGMSLGEMQTSLDRYYLGTKLMNSWLQLLADFMLNRKSDLEGLDEVLSMARLPRFREDFEIKIYRRVIEDFLQKDFSNSTFQFLKQNILPDLEKRSENEQLGYYNILSNYAILLIQFTGELPVQERFQLNQLALEKGYILRSGGISYAGFHNIVSDAVLAGELDWAEKFVAEYGERLPDAIQVPTIALERAQICEGGGKYQQALEILNQKEVFTSAMDKTLERVLRIKCYYALGKDDLLESFLESTRKYTARNAGLGDGLRQQVAQFTRLTQRLLHCRRSADPAEGAQSILTELAAGRIAAAQDWIQRESLKLIS